MSLETPRIPPLALTLHRAVAYHSPLLVPATAGGPCPSAKCWRCETQRTPLGRRMRDTDESPFCRPPSRRDETFRRLLRGHLVCGLVVACLGSCSVLSVADEPSVRVGFDGFVKVGQWTPVEVNFGQISGTVCEVESLDPDGNRVAQPLVRRAADRQPGVWSGVFRAGRLDGAVEVRLKDEQGQVVNRHRLLVQPGGASPITIARQSVQVWLEVEFNSPVLDESAEVHVVRWNEWPSVAETPWALDGVDGVLVSSRTALSDAMLAELLRWSKRGGHLVVLATSTREEFAATTLSPLLSELVDVRERTRTNDLSGIESFTVRSRRISGANRTPVTILAPKEGRTLVSCVEGPLVTRGCFGFGQVTVLGLDLVSPPFSKWDGRSAFLSRLLFRGTETANTKSAEGSRLSQSGITDLATQWRAATVELPEVARPSLWGVLGLLLAYALIIGPLDYVLVHKLLRRPHWTWVTLPLLVACAAVGMAWLARSVNGATSRLAQLDVVDIDARRQEVRARSWATAYMTDNHQWSVDAEPRTFGHAAVDFATTPLVSWLGFPENSPGGMYRTSGFDLGHLAYKTSVERQRLEGVPIGKWSTKSLTSEANWTAPQGLVESVLTCEGLGELNGSVIHRLPFTLTDWIVTFESRVFRPHPKQGEVATKWAPNQPWDPNSSMVYQRELRGFLTRTKATKIQTKKGTVSEDILNLQERYNPLNLEPDDILLMMTLHEAAGGKSYTGLGHNGMRSFDLSPHLSLDRAVLIARLPEPQTNWKFDGEVRSPTRSNSFVRMLLPVKRQAQASSEFRQLPKFESDGKPLDPAKIPATAKPQP